MLKLLAMSAITGTVMISASWAQETAPAASKPTEHVIGTVTVVDAGAHYLTVKEDKTGLEHGILLQNTKTLLKVEPGAKDLKNATRITADDLETGDRVDVRGFKSEDDPNAIAARSVILMSVRDLQQAHQAEAAAWQHSVAGLVSSVDNAAGKLNITVKAPEGQKAVVVDVPKTAQFTRYSPEKPKTPVASQLTDIQAGDQVRVIGDKSADGSTITAQKIYSGAFRTLGGTVASVSPDGKQITVKSAGNQIIEVTLNDESAVRKLPPEMAMRLAMRLNPSYKPAQGGSGPSTNTGAAGNTAGTPPYGAKAGEAAGGPQGSEAGNPGATAGAGRWQGQGSGAAVGARGGDFAQMIERVPKISVSDLKPGDAVLVAGAATAPDNSRLVATNIIAGAEPILRAAPPRRGQSQNSDWNLGMDAPAQQ